jgi:hypothetical protein
LFQGKVQDDNVVKAEPLICIDEEIASCYIVVMIPRSCRAVYYGGLPVKGSRRKGRLWVEEEAIRFTVPGGREGEKIDLKIPFPRTEKIFLTRDNYYGADTVLFNLTFRDEAEKSFTLRFAPIAVIPRRRIALQKEWIDYLARAVNPEAKSSPLSTK